MTAHTTARHLKPGDRITLCGRHETITRVEHVNGEINVYVPDDPNDPYLLGPNEIVPIHPAA